MVLSNYKMGKNREIEGRWSLTFYEWPQFVTSKLCFVNKRLVPGEMGWGWASWVMSNTKTLIRIDRSNRGTTARAGDRHLSLFHQLKIEIKTQKNAQIIMKHDWNIAWPDSGTGNALKYWCAVRLINAERHYSYLGLLTSNQQNCVPINFFSLRANLSPS